VIPVAVDAMGGDHAPGAVVAGAVRAAGEFGIAVALVGDEQVLRAHVDEQAAQYDAARIKDLVSIVHTSEWIAMDEPPAQALQRKRNASVLLAARMVAERKASGFVSAGNSGAAVGAALLSLGRLPGVERAPIATIIPLHSGRAVLLDAGANVDCKPAHLLQFAVMGSVYARRVLGVDSPRVALLSIGEEPGKGDSRTKSAHALLRESGLNFVGNLDGKDVFRGAADVVVCDGFVGNVVIKVGEGVVDLIAALLANTKGPQAASVLSSLADRVHWAEYGGAPLLGVDGVCVIAHGRSDARAVAHAVRVASQAAESGVVEGMRQELPRLSNIRNNSQGSRG